MALGIGTVGKQVISRRQKNRRFEFLAVKMQANRTGTKHHQCPEAERNRPNGNGAVASGISPQSRSDKNRNSNSLTVSSKPSHRHPSILDECGSDKNSRNAVVSTTASKPTFKASLMQSLLELAIYFESNRCVLFLLEHGASALASSDEKSATSRPLKMALKTGNSELLGSIFTNTRKNDFDNAIVNILDQNVNEKDFVKTVENILSHPVLHESKDIFFTALKRALKIALESGNYKLVVKFFSLKRLSDTKLLEKLSKDEKDALLFLALEKKNPAVAGCLIDTGASVFANNENGKTALELIVGTVQQETATELINKAIFNGENKLQIIDKILIYTIDNEKLELAESILQGTKLTEKRNNDSLRALYLTNSKVLKNSIKNGHPALATAIIDACLNADVTKKKLKPQLYRLLIDALTAKNSFIAQKLIDCMKKIDKARLFQEDKEGNSLLMHAITHEQTEAAKVLIDAGIDISAKNTSGDTALSIAMEQKNAEIASLLIGKKDIRDKIKSDSDYASFLLTEAINIDITLVEKLLQCLYERVSPGESSGIDSVPSSIDSAPPDSKSVSEIAASALEAAKPNAREVYVLFKSALAVVTDEEKGSNAVALELARYVRKHHRQFFDGFSSSLEEEMEALSEPEFASYLKEVDQFIIHKAAASSLVSKLRTLLHPTN